MLNKIKSYFSSFKIYFLLLLVPALYIAIWHIFDNSLPTSDGGGFFFRSVTNYANLFLEKDNFFESGIRYISDNML